jgi:hypothetical protein
LRAAGKVVKQYLDTRTVQFGVKVIDQKYGVLLKGIMVHAHLRQIKNKQGAALLP